MCGILSLMVSKIPGLGRADDEERAVPTGTRVLLLAAPGTSVPGFHIPPLRGLIEFDR
jgi:hypothetical protein